MVIYMKYYIYIYILKLFIINYTLLANYIQLYIVHKEYYDSLNSSTVA